MSVTITGQIFATAILVFLIGQIVAHEETGNTKELVGIWISRVSAIAAFFCLLHWIWF